MKLTVAFLTGFGFTVFISNALFWLKTRHNVQAALAIIGLSSILAAILLAVIVKS